MLSISLEAPDSIERGGRVTFRLIVQNSSTQAEDLFLRGREPTLDVMVSLVNGDVVWQSLEGQVIPAVLQILSLAPGEKLEVSTVWDQRRAHGLPLGTYLVRASLLTEGSSIDAPGRNLTITAPNQ